VYYLLVIVILEGPDLVGKTTLARRLREHAESADSRFREVRVSRRGPIPDGVSIYDEYVKPMAADVPDDTLWIADRWHLGELVYGNTLRDGSRFDRPGEIDFETLDRAIDALSKPFKIIMMVDDDVLAERHSRRGDSLTLDQVLAVARQYRKTYQFLRLRGDTSWVQLTIRGETPVDLADFVWDEMMRARR